MMGGRFLQRVSRMIEAFGARKFPTPVLERIERRTLDMNEIEFVQLTDLVIDNCQHAPTVAKIIEYANIVRGKRAAAEKAPEKPLVHACEECLDCGVVKIESPEGEDALARCRCFEGEAHWSNLPSVTDELARGFIHRRLNPLWFKPAQSSAAFEPLAMERKSTDWRAKVELAELYWAHRTEQTKANA